jgi:hypothetical protein
LLILLSNKKARIKIITASILAVKSYYYIFGSFNSNKS